MKPLMLHVLLGAAAIAQVVPAPGNVALPLDEYNVLVQQAARPPSPPDPSPVRHVLKSAEINLTVQAESVSGTVAIQGEVLANGSRKVPLLSGMIVTDAQQGAADLPLEHSGGVHSALLSGPGQFAVTLSTAIPLAIETGRASFNLPAPSAGAVRLTLVVPGAQTLVNLSPGLITSRTSSNGRTTIEAVLVPGQTSNIWWAARLNTSIAPAMPKEVRFLSDVKTLISVSEAELTVAALTEIVVVQGEPTQFRVQIPAGYELTGATGPTLTSSDVQGDVAQITVSNPAVRTHQFLFSLAKVNSSTRADIPLLTFTGTQRETGEVLIEGEGAMELVATEKGGLRRMDLKETNAYLRSLSGATLHAAFRYQKRPAETPAVALEWVRFPETSVLSAVAQTATVTTVVTSEGRSLTEVKLSLKNKAQPFLKLELPAGATILSADVAGEKVKPVQGADGSRVPLLRAGFRPAGAYEISFVFLHAGAPFEKKGDAELTLPRMDIPIGRMEWEVFLPQRYKVANFSGDAMSAVLLQQSYGPDAREITFDNFPLLPSEVGGTVIDPSGAVISGARVEVRVIGSGSVYRAMTDATGRWSLPNVPAGQVSVMVTSPGFKTYVREAGRSGIPLNVMLQVGEVSESITVTAETGRLNTSTATLSSRVNGRIEGTEMRSLPVMPPSTNVTNLQQRVAGVLPISVNVPRMGNSYEFVRALVMDEETKLTFKYHRQ